MRRMKEKKKQTQIIQCVNAENNERTMEKKKQLV